MQDNLATVSPNGVAAYNAMDFVPVTNTSASTRPLKTSIQTVPVVWFDGTNRHLKANLTLVPDVSIFNANSWTVEGLFQYDATALNLNVVLSWGLRDPAEGGANIASYGRMAAIGLGCGINGAADYYYVYSNWGPAPAGSMEKSTDAACTGSGSAGYRPKPNTFHHIAWVFSGVEAEVSNVVLVAVSHLVRRVMRDWHATYR